MADGGASTIIMLVTALLISSAASAVLVQEWSSASRAIELQQKGLQLSAEIGIDFAGDPAMVALSGTDQITFYIQNTGIHTMDDTTLGVMVDGISLNSAFISTTYVPVGSGAWDPSVLLEVTLENTDWNFATNDEITIFATARSVDISSLSASASMNEEVKLHV